MSFTRVSFFCLPFRVREGEAHSSLSPPQKNIAQDPTLTVDRKEGKIRETGGSEKRMIEAADENDSRSRMGSRDGIITRASSDREKRGSRV